MTTPVFLLGAALVFWGWQTGHLWLGVLAAIALEGIRWAQWRWELEEKDYCHINDLCMVLFVGAFIYAYTSEDLAGFVLAFMRWLPLLFLPMIAAQWFGPRETIGYRALSWLIRRKLKTEPPDSGLNVSYPYFALCLLSASAANPRNLTFFLGFCGMLAWALWSHRARRFPIGAWLLLLVSIMAAGWVLQYKLHEWQAVVEGRLSGWLYGWGSPDPNTKESRTSIGRIGKLKNSNRILLRLALARGGPPPARLRQASYRHYQDETWHGLSRDFVAVTGEHNEGWTLLPQAKTNGVVTIAGYLKHGKGVLALPHGTAQINHFPALEMERNSLGVVHVPAGPKFFNFQAQYGPGVSIDSLPEFEDRQMPVAEDEAITRIATELNLIGQPYAEVLKSIERFFINQFTYTLEQKAPHSPANPWPTPLGRFLWEHRAGHCEYFATATVLLLRKAGFPARYATGFSVQESPRQHKYVVRERHAHAWCLAFNTAKGVWEDFDTTPSAWNTLEARHTSWLQPLSDFWSNLWFQFNQWRYGQSKYRSYLVVILLPLVLILLWQIGFKKSKSRKKAAHQVRQPLRAFAGMDSEFYLIESELVRAGLPRQPGETLERWLRRLERDHDSVVNWAVLQPMVQLHYQYRFDPTGLNETERTDLKSKTDQWLECFHMEIAVGRKQNAE